MKTFSKIFTIFLLLIIVSVSAQIKVSGKITYRNKGIPNISITLKDTYDGATSDADGNYSFETSENGNHTLVFSNSKFDEVEKSIVLANENLTVNAELKERISEIEAVVISAGSIEASDKKRATALLTPIDIYTTAGADAQLTSALGFLPGVQKVGETEGLFVRGGTGAETKIFMDGSLINNYFTNSVPGIAGRDRFNTSLFKGNIFSSGGYSALYGQALSGVLILESVDLPETTSYDLGISPIFLTGSYQKLTNSKTASYGASLGYSNISLVKSFLKVNTDFGKAPQGINADANFRIKTKSGGFLKYYGKIDSNELSVFNESIEPEYDKNKVALKGNSIFQNLSFKQRFGRYLVNVGTSYTYNKTDVDFSSLLNDVVQNNLRSKITGNYFNIKTVVDRKINKISALRGGFEFNNAQENSQFGTFQKNYSDLISAGFLETDLGFSNNFSAKLGVRAENSSYLKKWNFAPRVAVAYRLAKDFTTSLAYGMFYQNPESKYINSDASLKFQKADHYIFQLQRNTEGRNLRFEAFYKKYDDLIKTNSNEMFQTATNNNGNGFAKGFELFWRDKKSIKNIDYWITYSYLDSKRDFQNYPVSLMPGFAAEHTVNVVAKKFVTKWKTGFNMSYTYSSGRPYYDIVNDNGQNIIRQEGRLKDFSGLNFSLNYLPNLGKTDSKAFTVLVLSVSNILGSKNVFGYNFSNDGMRSSAVVPPINTFVFIGAFISFGVDRTNDAINNNL